MVTLRGRATFVRPAEQRESFASQHANKQSDLGPESLGSTPAGGS